MSIVPWVQCGRRWWTKIHEPPKNEASAWLTSCIKAPLMAESSFPPEIPHFIFDPNMLSLYLLLIFLWSSRNIYLLFLTCLLSIRWFQTCKDSTHVPQPACSVEHHVLQKKTFSARSIVFKMWIPVMFVPQLNSTSLNEFISCSSYFKMCQWRHPNTLQLL